jgi:hypothetical protein
MAFACHGHVTREDYETILVPRITDALKRHDKLRLYYQIGNDFTGIDPGAVWEDFKVGMGHVLSWEKVAVVTDVDWVKRTISFFGLVIPGETKVFPLCEAAEARTWITEV